MAVAVDEKKRRKKMNSVGGSDGGIGAGKAVAAAASVDVEALKRTWEEEALGQLRVEMEETLREELRAEFATRLTEAEAEAADAEAELDDLRAEIVSLRRREETAEVTAIEARRQFGDFERQRDIAETSAAVERRAKEEALEEAKASRLAEQKARDAICAAMEEAEAARQFAAAADERAAAAVARADACEAFGDAAYLAETQANARAEELVSEVSQLVELVETLRPEMNKATKAAAAEKSTVGYLRMRLAVAAAAAAPALERAAKAEGELANARELAASAESKLLEARYREARSEGALQQEAAAKDMEAAEARRVAAAADARAAAAEEENAALRIKIAAADKVISRTATDRAVHALATKAAEARVEAAEMEARQCREESQRLRVERDAALHDVERREKSDESVAEAAADAERRLEAVTRAEAAVAGVVNGADARVRAMVDALSHLIEELPSAEAAAGASRRRPLATDRAVETAKKLVADAEAAQTRRPSSVPCESGGGRLKRDEAEVFVGGGGFLPSPSPSRHIPRLSRSPEKAAAGDDRGGGRQVVSLPRVDSLKKQNRRPVSGHAVPSPRSRARNLLLG